MKENGTFRERLSGVDFSKVFEKGFVYKWSRDRGKILKRVIVGQKGEEENKKKYVPFMIEPDIKTNDFTVSYQWNELNKTIKKYKGFAFFPAGRNTNITAEECEEYFREKRSDMDFIW